MELNDLIGALQEKDDEDHNHIVERTVPMTKAEIKTHQELQAAGERIFNELKRLMAVRNKMFADIELRIGDYGCKTLDSKNGEVIIYKHRK